MLILNILRRSFTGPVELLMEVLFSIGTRIIAETGLIIPLICILISLPMMVLGHWSEAVRIPAKDPASKQHFQRSSLLRYLPLWLLPEILHFTAGFLFLNDLVVLHGLPFLMISDLGVPDNLIHIEGFSLNILPILMTMIRSVSNLIRMRELPAVRKIHVWAVTILYLYLLYSSSAGFALYWLVYELLCLGKVLLFRNGFPEMGTGFATEISPADRSLFWLSCIYLTILAGIQIPSMVIRSAPSDFINISNYYSPFHYILSTLLIAAGTFVIWPGIAFLTAPAPVRKAFSFLSAAAAVCGTLNVMLFGNDRGIMSAQLVYDKDPDISGKAAAVNFILLALAILILWMIRGKKPLLLNFLIFVLCITKAAGMAANCVSIANDLAVSKKTIAATTHLRDHEEPDPEEEETRPLPEIPLSKDGKNVIVLMLDRSIGYLLPFIMGERSELLRQFEGFTFYPNTVSFGSKTNEGAPALFGGYEYTPERINEREDENLAEKHNEALRLMPVLFDEAGYRVTVIDPPYAGYQTISDLNIYNDHPGIEAWHAEDMLPLADDFSETEGIMDRNRNFFCYSFYRISPLLIQPVLYSKGTYNQADTLLSFDDLLTARTDREGFQKAYNVLVSLPEMTVIEEHGDTFFIMDNRTTHEPTLLQLPDYTLTNQVDNTPYETIPIIRTSMDGRTLQLNETEQETHYHVNMAAFIQLGAWMDQLRENDVYDNTRIIIVSDHGHPLGYSEFRFGDEDFEEVLTFNPILMVKDFDSRIFSVDESFMTNADIPTLALDGLIKDPVNPATGQPVTDTDKYTRDILIKHTEVWNVKLNNGDDFLPGDWYRLHGKDIFDTDQWEFMGRR